MMNKERVTQLLLQYMIDNTAGDDAYRMRLTHWLGHMFSMLVETIPRRSVWAKPPFFHGDCADYVHFMQHLPLAPGPFVVSVIDEETFAIEWKAQK